MKRSSVLLVLLFLMAPAVSVAQTPADGLTDQLIHVEMDFPNGPELELSGYNVNDDLVISVTDNSQDGTPNGGPGNPHRVRLSVTPIGDDTGWRIFVPFESFAISPGQTQEASINVRANANAEDSFLRILINVTIESQICCGSSSTEATALIRTPGSFIAFVRPASETTLTLRPDSVYEGAVSVENPSLLDRDYRLEVVNNPCDMHVSSATTVVPATETRMVQFVALTPSDSFFYNQQNCPLTMQMVDQDTGQPSTPANFQIKVHGFFVDPGDVINLVIVLVVIGVIIWLILLAKRRAEEEVLGKPQPPWTLPAEQLYLAELEKKDPQAAYVVRHFLMEDEYASSLLWYKAYKKATKGRRAVERKVLKLEHKFEKWDLKQQDNLDSADDKGEKQVEKLQRKLDRKTKKAWKKEHKTWKKQVNKLETKAANAHNKALAAWEKDAKKARKKGQAAPKQPSMRNPDLPEEPEHVTVELDDHKWAAKKERILAKASAQDDKAYAAYEKERAKRQRALRRDMQKLAAKIDDPEFVAEHPLLLEASTA